MTLQYFQTQWLNVILIKDSEKSTVIILFLSSEIILKSSNCMYELNCKLSKVNFPEAKNTNS